MLPRTRLIRIQKHLYHKVRKDSQVLSQNLSPKLRKYFEDYERDLKNYEALASKRELQIAVLNSPIILVGDYHTLAQAQRTVLRLIGDATKFLKRKKRRVVLALEMLAVEDNDVVNAYLREEISERALLREIAFKRNWGFHWPNYQRLFKFAKKEGVGIVGINSHSKNIAHSLESRDKYAAKVLAQMTLEEPNTTIFVLIGDLHLATRHLPQSLRTALRKSHLKRRVLTIHQNYEPFYWKLVESGTEEIVEIVRIKKDSYCILNTPPWIKLHSHLQWVQTASNPKEWDHTSQIREMIEVLSSFFEIRSAPRKFEDYEAHGPGNSDFLKVLQRKHLYSKMEWDALLLGLDTFGFQIFPKEKHLYALSSNPNYWAELSARYLHSKLSGFDRVLSDPKQDFYPILMIEALGYLCSKILNPKRKCPSREKLQQAIRRSATPTEERKAAELALSHLKNLRLPPGNESPGVYLLTAAYLGKLLGESIYLSLIQNRIQKEEIKKLFFMQFPRGGRAKVMARKVYREWVKRLG
jgi:hypothetical protein